MPYMNKGEISAIRGKMVSIRHATSSDLVRVEEYLKPYHAISELDNAEVAVAAEDRRIIGFGILKRENENGCISLFEDSRRKGIGSLIMKHLLEYSPIRKVYAARYASYFTHPLLSKPKAGRVAANAKRRVPCRAPLMEPLRFAVSAKP